MTIKECSNYRLFNWLVPIGVVIIFVLIELIVRIFVPFENVSEIELGPLSMFEKFEKENETWYRITGKYSTTNYNVEFKEIPDDGVFRVVVLGGSAAAGWPHPSNQTFSSYLGKTLNNINQNRRTEVINCAAHGFASYRVLNVFRQVKKWHPDVVIVWSGNNEFLEKRNIDDGQIIQILRKVGCKIRIVQVMNKKFIPQNKIEPDIDVAGTFWKKTRKEALKLRTDDKKFANVKKVYSRSIGKIAKEAEEKNIKLLLMTVPVNLRDWQPNVSTLIGSDTDSIVWYNYYKNGRGKMIQGKIDDAISELKNASEIQPEHAETWYWLADAYEQKGDKINAYNCYSKARDFDMNPFRTLSMFNDSIRSLSKRYNVPLFDAEEVFKKYSKNGIPGFDMFIDYVHPSKKGNLVICYNVAEIINDLPYFNSNSTINSITDEIKKISENSYVDEYDINMQIIRFSLFCVNHQEYSVISFGNRFLETVPPEILNNKKFQPVFDKIEAGVDAFTSKIEADYFEFSNGTVSKKQKEIAKEKIDSFFNTYYPYGTY